MPGTCWRFAAETRSVRAARHLVGAYADAQLVPEPPLEDLKLAVNEAVANSVMHAFRAAGAGTITVTIDVTPGHQVTVRVVDDGDGLAPRHDSPGAGFGLALMNALATSTNVRSGPSGHGTEVQMTFAFAG